MNDLKGRVSTGETPARRFTPPKGYGGFIPVIDEVSEGEWTLGVAPAPPPRAPAGTSNVDSAASPSPRPKPDEPEIPVMSDTGRNALDEIPLRPAGTPFPRRILGDIQGRELPSPPLVRRVIVAPAASRAPRHSKALWLLVILLALGLAGETWYGLGVIREHDIQLPGVQVVGSALGAVKSRLHGLVSRPPAQVHPQEEKVAAASGDIPPQTHAAGSPAVSPMSDQAGKNPTSVPSGLSQSNAKTRPEVPTSLPFQTQRLQPAPQDRFRSAQATPSTRAASPRHEVDRHPTQAHSPASEAPRPRVDFEVSRNSAREIVPGISLRVTATNVRDQRYDGYLWLMSDGSALWLSNVGVQHPIVFYPQRGGQADQIVVTRITDNSVVGYLLQPVHGAATQGENRSLNSAFAGLYAEFTTPGKKSR